LKKVIAPNAANVVLCDPGDGTPTHELTQPMPYSSFDSYMCTLNRGLERDKYKSWTNLRTDSRHTYATVADGRWSVGHDWAHPWS